MIHDQLKEYCGCVEVHDKDVDELINMISIATCWMDKPCNTFLKGDRREVIDLPTCMDCAYEFTPFYHPFDPETFSFKLLKIDGTSQTITEIEDFSYSEYTGKFLLDTGLPSCKCAKTCKCACTCECEPEYKLIAEYNAGYDEIPDCLLPVFCNLLEVIHAKNDCSCDDCGCGDKYHEDSIEYATGDVVTVALETDLGKMLVADYKKQLGMISLCEGTSDVWGFVV